jgi:hypothetical protein
MFRTSITRLAARCAAAIDDLLAADFDGYEQSYESPEDTAGVIEGSLAYHRGHPHRVPLASARERRPGRVPAAPAHCLSPVQTAAGGTRRRTVAQA